VQMKHSTRKMLDQLSKRRLISQREWKQAVDSSSASGDCARLDVR
jgi:hypothetical protein